VTLLISIFAITNMALGYGLAVYFSKSCPPVPFTFGRSRKSKGVVDFPSAESSAQSATPVESNEASNATKSKGPIGESESTSTVTVEEETPALPRQVPQLDVQDLMPESQTSPESELEAPEEVSESELESLAQQLPTAVAESSDEDKTGGEVATPEEEEVLAGIKDFQAQLQEQMALEGSEEPVAETKPAEDLPNAEVLDGIDSFREQLAKM